MEIHYRNADIGDLDEVCLLVDRAVREMLRLNIRQWDEQYPVRADFEQDIEQRQLFVGTLNGRIVVVFVLNQVCDAEYQNGAWTYDGKDFCVIHRLCVNPSDQNRGIAKNALQYIESSLKERGIFWIRLDVFSKNPYAFRLYDHLGYVRVGTADWRMGSFYLMEKQIAAGKKKGEQKHWKTMRA